MVEWRVEEALEDEAPPPPKPPRLRLGWRSILLVGGVLMLVLIVAVGILRWREVIAEHTIEADLLTAIRAEEQARRFGLEDKASQFIPTNTPGGWRDRFTRTFTPTLPSAVPLSVSISLISISLQGQEAEVMVQVGQQLQERRYRLTEQGWQRIPVFAEGRGNTITISPAAITLTYQEADAAFADTLRADFPALQAQLQAWGGTPKSPIIEIHSEEFYPPAYYVNFNNTYRLSSPRVLTLPSHWDMTGEEAVRYRFAKAVWHDVPQDDISNRRLPGASRFVLAAHTLLSLKWAVSERTYQGFIERWHATASPQSTDALYSRPTHTGWMDIFAPAPEEASVLLLVDTIFNVGGAEGLAEIARTMPTAEDWDSVFQTPIGMSTRQLLAIAGGESVPPLPGNSTAVVKGSPTLSEGWGSRYFQVNGNGDTPVWVERTFDSEVFINNIEGLPEDCAVLFSDVRVEGIWREEGLRLTAERYIAANELLPLSPAPLSPPTNSQLYVSRLGNLGVFPSYGSLDAVQSDGTATTLWEGRPLAVEVFNHDTSVPREGIMVAKYPGPTRQEVVFYRWEPEGGIVGAWMAHVPNGFGSVSVWWDSRRNVGLLTRTLYNAVDTETWYWWLRPEQPFLTNEPDGHIPGGPVVALRPDSTQVVLANAEQNRITLYDVSTQTTIWERTYGNAETFGAIRFDSMGKFLYVPESHYGVTSGSSLTRYTMETGRSDVLLENDAPFGVYDLQMDTVTSAIYAIVNDGDALSLVAIEKNGVHTVYTYTPGESTLHFLSCRGGGALLVTYIPPHTNTDILAPRIRRITPDGILQPDALSMNDYGFPLLCE